MLTLETNIEKIHRVGKTTASRLKRFGIETVRDLLYYLPFRYEDYRKITKIAEAEIGVNLNIVGQIELIQNKRSPRKRMYITEALISDETEQLKVVWFNQPFIAKNLREGDKVSLAGKIEEDYGVLTMKSPAYEKITSQDALHTARLVPIYHLTLNLTQKQLRYLIKTVIELANTIEEWLPTETVKRQDLISIGQALNNIHFPKKWNDINKGRDRLAFNELFLLQLQSLIIKAELEGAKAEKITFKEAQIKNFVKSLPFIMTNDQKKTAWEIIQDMETGTPMSRLLEGDVGSGKTIVALIAMLNNVLNKKQSVIMAPTEILAQQHFKSFNSFLANFKVKIGMLTHSKRLTTDCQEKNLTKKQFNEKLSSGELDIIIGTHALIQEDIKFKNLSLAIIDEQHRFGVEQRKKLIEKSNHKSKIPHLLSMTATPIPRSLALALYGDLSISIIKEMPKGRKTILTKVVPEAKRVLAYDFIKKQIKAGRQIFVICPLIDMSDKLGVKSVKEEFKKLDKTVFHDLRVAMLHGRLKPKEKDEIMQNFIDKKTDVLVSTSVLEVGVDIPNATIMMIEGADRFGLAQLHQFRGRVGRSEHQSYCFLFTDSDSKKTAERLNTLTKVHDGFTLAKADLKYRGPGEVFGIAQKGFPELKIASLFDYELIKKARQEAELILKNDSKLKNNEKLRNFISTKLNQTHLE